MSSTSTVRSRDDLRHYQQRVAEFVKQHPFVMLQIEMSLGKAQPNSEPILTPDGWVRMGDLRPGDFVIGGDGYPCQVLGVFPQGERDVYKITFTDKTFTYADLDHLWAVRTGQHAWKNKPYQVKSARELLEIGLTESNGKVQKWCVPMCPAVRYPEQALPIDPYLLGVILGDGNVNKFGRVRITTDSEIAEQFPGLCYEHYSEGIEERTLKMEGLGAHLKALSLAGKRSYEKHIPEIYLRASVVQRVALLQGLLDTDGYCQPNSPTIEYYSSSSELMRGVIELVQSLGGNARLGKTKNAPTFRHKDGSLSVGRPAHRCVIRLPADVTPFRLERKAAQYRLPQKRPPARRILSIEEVGREAATCIRVDREDGLYVTRNHIVTHNTAICLTAIADLLRDWQIKGALVLAPRRVAETVWHTEAQAWEHTRHLRVCVLRGRSKAALARDLTRPYDVWVINYESLPWLYTQINHLFLSRGRYPPFDMLVFDEVTRVKHPTGKRIGPWHAKTRGVNLLAYFPRKVGLTGTPAPNGYKDLFGQYLAVDDGQRLGVSQREFVDRWFEQNPYERRVWLKAGAREEIERRIADITVSLEAKDYLELPPYVENDIWIDLPPQARAQYDQLEAEMFAQFDEGGIEVFDAATLTMKCRQLANGAVRHHEDPSKVFYAHEAKLEVLDEILEEAAGSGVLISYIFRPDAERILARYKHLRIGFLGPGVSDTQANEMVADWNKGRYDALMSHYNSAGHGLNLQHGGHQIVWFGGDYNYEGWDQMNARLRRPGQTSDRVIVHRILARQTVDETIVDNLRNKYADQRGLRDAMKRYQEKRLET